MIGLIVHKLIEKHTRWTGRDEPSSHLAGGAFALVLLTSEHSQCSARSISSSFLASKEPLHVLDHR